VAVCVIEGWRASLDAATTGEVAEAEDDDRDLFARFAGCCWGSVVKLWAWETAEPGSDSAFLFMPVCRRGREAGFGGGESGFCAPVGCAECSCCGDW
jgi:hypothetical protein